SIGSAESRSSAASRTNTRSPPDSRALQRKTAGHSHVRVFKPHTTSGDLAGTVDFNTMFIWDRTTRRIHGARAPSEIPALDCTSLRDLDSRRPQAFRCGH